MEDDWESPTLGASGLGWEVWLDGMEITQFTYFQLAGSIELIPSPVEITYGLERITMYLQGVDNVYDLKWNDRITYGDVHHQQEVEAVHLQLRDGRCRNALRISSTPMRPNPGASSTEALVLAGL